MRGFSEPYRGDCDNTRLWARLWHGGDCGEEAFSDEIVWRNDETLSDAKFRRSTYVGIFSIY